MGQSTLIPTETALDCAPGVVQLISDCKAAWREKEYKNACKSILIKHIYSWNCHYFQALKSKHSKHQLVKSSSATWAPCSKGAWGLLWCWCPGADAACLPFIVVASLCWTRFYLSTSEMPQSKEAQRMR